MAQAVADIRATLTPTYATRLLPDAAITVTPAGNVSLGLNISAATAWGEAGAPAVAVALWLAWANRTSSLFAAGAATASLSASIPPAFTMITLPAPTFPHCAALAGPLKLCWQLYPAGVRGSTAAALPVVALRAVWTGPRDAWWGVGWNTVAMRMAGSDAVVWEPVGNGTAVQVTMTPPAANGMLQSPTVTRLLPTDGGVWGASVVRPNATSTATTLTWWRSLACTTPYVGCSPLPATGGGLWVVYAFGGEGQSTLGRHSSSNAGGGAIDLATGTFAPETWLTWRIIVAHAIVMVAGWMVLFPLGIGIARYTRGIVTSRNEASPFWLTAHRVVQSIGLVLVVIGFILALAAVPSGRHFTAGHHWLGLLLVLWANAQPIMACLRPRKGGAGGGRWHRVWSACHRGGAVIAITLSVPTAFLGMLLRNTTLTPYVLLCLWLTLVVGLFAAVEGCARRCCPTAGSNVPRGKGGDRDGIGEMEMSPLSPRRPPPGSKPTPSNGAGGSGSSSNPERQRLANTLERLKFEPAAVDAESAGPRPSRPPTSGLAAALSLVRGQRSSIIRSAVAVADTDRIGDGSSIVVRMGASSNGEHDAGGGGGVRMHVTGTTTAASRVTSGHRRAAGATSHDGPVGARV